MQTSTQGSGFIGHNTHLQVITFLIALASLATTRIYRSSPSLYGKAMEHFSKVKPPFSIIYIAYCVNSAPRSARILLNESRWVISSRWPLVECITTLPSQWWQCETVVWLVLGGWSEWLAHGDRYRKQDQNDFGRHCKHSYSHCE